MKELSKSELGLIMGGSTEDWCKAVKTIVSNIENHGNLPTDGSLHDTYEKYNKVCKQLLAYFFNIMKYVKRCGAKQKISSFDIEGRNFLLLIGL